MSRHDLRDHLIRSANWFIFRAWPHIRRWLWVLHRVALFVAFALSLLALLATICQNGLNDRPRDLGAAPWTTRVWAADRDSGVTIRATTGRATPDHRPSRFRKLLRVVFVSLVVLAVVATSMIVLIRECAAVGGTGPPPPLVQAAPRSFRRTTS